MERPKYKRVRISDTQELKSGLEEAVHIFLTEKNVDFTYEGMRICFSQPTKLKKYTPDFPIKKSFIIETKGKHKLIKKQHPHYDIRFIFSNSKTKIGKKSQTTYGKWCDLFNFKYHCVASTKLPFPKEWLTEIRKKQNATRN